MVTFGRPPHHRGTFADNPLRGIINGPMWTIRYEVGSYAVVFGLGIAGRLKRRPLVVLGRFVVLAAASILSPSAVRPDHLRAAIATVRGVGRLSAYFLAGMTLSLYRAPARRSLAAATVVAIAVGLVWPVGLPVALLVGVKYRTICIAEQPWLLLPRFGRPLRAERLGRPGCSRSSARSPLPPAFSVGTWPTAQSSATSRRCRHPSRAASPC